MFSKTKTKTHESAAGPEAVPMTADTSPVPAETSAQTSETQPPAAPETAPSATAAQPSSEAADLAVQKDRYARLMADFDNFRKRQIREREDLIKRANEDLLGDLLPVVDHLELALSKTADPDAPFVVGVRLVYDQFISLLNRYGMKPIDAKGEPFDTAFHEALSEMSSPAVPANVVIDQFRRGWLLGGRLLRPSQVIVSSGAPDPKQTESENDSVSD